MASPMRFTILGSSGNKIKEKSISTSYSNNSSPEYTFLINSNYKTQGSPKNNINKHVKMAENIWIESNVPILNQIEIFKVSLPELQQYYSKLAGDYKQFRENYKNLLIELGIIDKKFERNSNSEPTTMFRVDQNQLFNYPLMNNASKQNDKEISMINPDLQSLIANIELDKPNINSQTGAKRFDLEKSKMSNEFTTPKEGYIIKKEELIELRNTIRKLEEEKINFIDQLQKIQIGYKAQINELNNKLSQNSSYQKGSINDEIEQLRIANNKLEQEKNIMESLTKELKKNYESKILSLNSQLTEMSVIHTASTKEATELRKHIINITEEKTNLQKQIDELRKIKNEYEIKLNKADMDIQNLHSMRKKDQAQEVMKKASAANPEAKNDISKFKEEISHYLDIISKKDEQIRQQQDKLLYYERQISMQAGQIDQLTKNNAQLKSKVAGLLEQNWKKQEAEDQIAYWRDKFIDSEKKTHEVEEKYKDLKVEKVKLEEKVKINMGEKLKLVDLLKKLQEYEKQHVELENLLTKKEIELEQLKSGMNSDSTSRYNNTPVQSHFGTPKKGMNGSSGGNDDDTTEALKKKIKRYEERISVIMNENSRLNIELDQYKQRYSIITQTERSTVQNSHDIRCSVIYNLTTEPQNTSSSNGDMHKKSSLFHERKSTRII